MHKTHQQLKWRFKKKLEPKNILLQLRSCLKYYNKIIKKFSQANINKEATVFLKEAEIATKSMLR